MRRFALPLYLALAGCTALPTPDDGVDLRDTIVGHDIAMNRPNTDTPEATFRMFADGSGTVNFNRSASGPQPVHWSLTGDVFCIITDEGLIASFGCATAGVTGAKITLAHTETDNVVMGVFVPR